MAFIQHGARIANMWFKSTSNMQVKFKAKDIESKRDGSGWAGNRFYSSAN